MTMTIESSQHAGAPDAPKSTDRTRERAIALNVEACKAWWSGDRSGPVHQLAFEALNALRFDPKHADEIAIRFATYLLNLATQPGYEPTIAFDGDLEHPEDEFGVVVDAAGATA
ncbi:hypothetical protein [Streptomyces sp. SGAir0957]